MKAAIYARYSSENQRPESIEDQVRECRQLAATRGYSVDPAHIYTDEAKSGALNDRPGLEALLAAAGARQFEAVLVDDLSRLSRDNHFLLTLYAEFRFNGVRIISRADSLDSDDQHAKLGFQMRGIVNELYLDDLREKTLRGQKGQKARGFIVGEATYGYKSVPVGEMRVDRRGRPRPDGYRMVIDPSEAQVVLRVFRDFSEGKTVKSLTKALNVEEVQGRRKFRQGWSPSTISRMLKNEKYIGRWIWNRSETRRDPKTGRKRRFPKPENEWYVSQNDELRIVPQEIWDRAAARWKEIDHSWPQRRANKIVGPPQRSYVETNPPHLLSGALHCGACAGTIGQVSGKGIGYYGCLAATRGACANKLLVSRRITEKAVLTAVKERLRDPVSIRYVLERVEAEVKLLYAHLPEEIHLKRAALVAEKRRIANYISFIGEGKGTRALGEALRAAEQKALALRAELQACEASEKAVFKAPPVEWIAARLMALQSVLEAETSKSALVLRGVLGRIRLLPVQPHIGKPYYQAETALRVLDLVKAPEDGSNWLQWWTLTAGRPSGLLAEFERQFGHYSASRWMYGTPWPSPARTQAMGDGLARALEKRSRAARWLATERLEDWDVFIAVSGETHSAIEALWYGVDPSHPLHGHPSAGAAGRGILQVHRALDRMVGELVSAAGDAAIVAFAMGGMGPNHSDVPSMVLLAELLFRDAFGHSLLTLPPEWTAAPSSVPILAEEDDWSTSSQDWVPMHTEKEEPRSSGPLLSLARGLPVPIKAVLKAVRAARAEWRAHKAPVGRWPLDWQPAERYRTYWSRMPAFVLPSFYDGRVRINLRGRERRGIVELSQYEETCRAVETLLHECRDPRTGEPAVDAIERPWTRNPLALTTTEADLLVAWRGAVAALEHPRLGLIGPVPFRRTGGHTGPHGMAYIAAPGLEPGDHGVRSAFDVVPTIVRLLGGEPPAHMSGKSLL